MNMLDYGKMKDHELDHEFGLLELAFWAAESEWHESLRLGHCDEYKQRMFAEMKRCEFAMNQFEEKYLEGTNNERHEQTNE
tara:strand:+ start:654 stop:896 length:243 start_codon:yes stop_codon:yes gene_type:complete